MRGFRRAAVLTACLALCAAATAGAQAGLSAEAKKALHDPTDPVVRMSTTMGDITIELYKKDAPKTVDNFLAYVKKKQYDGTIFHRVMPNFMIQGGGYDQSLTEKATGAPIVNEAKLPNEVGTIAMARLDDPNSATAQFFINVKTNKFLDKSPAGAGYAVFGKVVDGMDVVKAIEAVKTKKQPPLFEALPMVTVSIKSVTVVK